jgi:hypothetical protein
MPNYQNGKIYAIRSYQTDEIYIGSTTQELSKRLYEHKIPSNPTASKEIIQHGDAYIELLEEYPCDNKQQLLRREGQLIRENNCVNKRVAGRSGKEWREENKEYIKIKDREKYLKNADKIKERSKQYRINNADYVKDQQKQYSIKNKDKKADYCKEWYKNNKETQKAKMREVYNNTKDIRTCVCGVEYNYDIKQRRKKHYSSKFHIDWVENFYARLRNV